MILYYIASINIIRKTKKGTMSDHIFLGHINEKSTWLGRLLKLKARKRKYISEHGDTWYRADTGKLVIPWVWFGTDTLLGSAYSNMRVAELATALQEKVASGEYK